MKPRVRPYFSKDGVRLGFTTERRNVQRTSVHGRVEPGTTTVIGTNFTYTKSFDVRTPVRMGRGR